MCCSCLSNAMRSISIRKFRYFVTEESARVLFGSIGFIEKNASPCDLLINGKFKLLISIPRGVSLKHVASSLSKRVLRKSSIDTVFCACAKSLIGNPLLMDHMHSLHASHCHH